MKFVELSKYGFVIEPRYYYFGWSKSGKILGRSSAVKALLKARALLPKGYNFKIWDMRRPRSVQLAMIQSFVRRFKVEHPNLSSTQRLKLVYNFAAKPLLKVTRPDTHRNGGAVDLTIVNKFGQELPMGTDHDSLTLQASTNYYDKLSKLSEIEKIYRQNRKLLVKVMLKAGFENYNPEWWHWSYGK